MRLIDADELVKLLKAITMSNGTLINTNTMLAVVEKMPPAYDVQKVVKELEEWSFETKILVQNNNELGEYEEEVERKIICTQNAIEIVKHGSMSESDQKLKEMESD